MNAEIPMCSAALCVSEYVPWMLSCENYKFFNFPVSTNNAVFFSVSLAFPAGKIICNKILSGLFQAVSGPEEPETNPAFYSWFRISEAQDANMPIFILCIKETQKCC